MRNVNTSTTLTSEVACTSDTHYPHEHLALHLDLQNNSDLISTGLMEYRNIHQPQKTRATC